MRDIAFREKELDPLIRAFPAARVLRFSDAGHFVPEGKPVELAREMRACLGMAQDPEAGAVFPAGSRSVKPVPLLNKDT